MKANKKLRTAAPPTLDPRAIHIALAHQHAGRLPEAEAIYRQILQIEPRHADALHLLGLIALHMRKYDIAIDLIMQAIGIAPSAIFYGNLGNVLNAAGKQAAAIESFRQAIALQPDYVQAHNNLGNALRARGLFDDAVQSFRTVIALNPAYAEAHNNLANAYVDLGNLDAAIGAYRNAIALTPELAVPRSNLLFTLSYRPDTSPADYLADAIDFGELVTARAKAFSTWHVDTNANVARPLRIGFVSGDLRMHPTGYFLESILTYIDPAKLQLVAYATQARGDALTARIQPYFAEWHCIAGLSEEAAARQIREDRIDILLDLSGHMNENRLELFAWKPAPLQVSWLGYFASTGLRSIDYILGDRHVLPESEAPHFTEEPWRLPDSYLCFTPPEQHVDVGSLPALTNGAVTFGCFNHLMKMNDGVVAVWARVLKNVPGSRLFLKARQLDNAPARQATLDRFAAHGIEADRLILEGASPRAEYLAAYNRVDISLSPFPYPGGTTTAEGLWMGAPVLCRQGDRFLSHLCESVLQSAGLADWIATDDDDYVARAVAFANDLPRLASTRARLRDQVMASPLCDAPRFAKNLEAAFIEMWQRRWQ